MIVRALALVLLLAGIACEGETGTSAVTAPPVMVVPVDAHSIVERIQVTGSLLAKEEASLATELSGIVTSILADEGAAVAAGAPVLEIDPERRQLERDSQQAQLEQAKAALEEQRRETERVRSLHARDVASQSQLDQAELQLRLARSRLSAARAQVGLAERALADATVNAPFSGLVARRHVSAGEFVSVGQKLLDLVALDPIEFEFYLPERDASRVSLGQTVGVSVAPYPDEVFSARVTVISPRIDPRTRTLRVKASLANADGRLRPGLFARADLGVSERSGVPMVPEDAILQRSDGSIAFRLVEGNRVERIKLRTGIFRNGRVEVVEGLSVGDRVVVRGQTALVDGSVVSLRDEVGTPVNPAVANGGQTPVRLADVTIQRPILTWMMTLTLVVFGALGYSKLGVDQFPDMDFPILTVIAELEGASPEGIEEDVTDVLEEQFNTIGGVRNIRSSSFQGATQIMVEFQLGKDLDVAAQEVRDKLARARRRLPRELEPPAVDSFNANDHPILWIPIQSDRTPVETSEYVRRHIKPVFETIEGVAGVFVWGQRDRNIRIWLDGDALRARGLSAGDVLAALRREHVEIPGGLVEGDRVEYSVKTEAEFDSVEALERLHITHQEDAPVHLADVARVEDGSQDVRMISRYNSLPAVGLGIQKRSDGNSVAIVDEVYRRLDEISAILPEGIDIDESVGFIDFSYSVRRAVDETLFTLAFGALLAVLTVLVFLRRARPTLIIAAAIPISLIATFALVWAAGYTLNTMTLLGMTLAVGVVIDDAIVVLENIERHREAGAQGAEAASTGTSEIAFAATAATVSVAAVFVPVIFVEGIVGNFLGEFGLTVAGAVLISLFVALTLTPMLAARMPPPRPPRRGGLYDRLERGFAALEAGYRRVLYWTLAHRAQTLAISLGAFLLALFFGSRLSGEFFPPTDEGIVMTYLEAAPGTALDATLEYLKRDEDWWMRQPELAGMFSAAGSGRGGPDAPPRSNLGMMFMTLVPLEDRERSVHELMDDARAALGGVPGRQIRIFNPSEMMRTGGSAGMGALELELRGNLPLAELDELSDRFIEELAKTGRFVDLDKSLKLGLPELRVIPDREKAAALGVDARSVAAAIQMMVGGIDVGVYKEAGYRYDIRMRLEEGDRSDPEAIGRLFVRAKDGGVVELRNLIRVETGAAPSAITRSNRQRSVTVGANLSGVALGDAIIEARTIAARILPEYVTLGLAGQAQAMEEGLSQLGVALSLALLVIYMVLAAQFESLVHPLSVMLAVPLAMAGALGGLWVFGQTLNLFSLIGILLLFGLATKNSILVVDYANKLRARGMDKVEAMRTAAPIRMRPVLMTAGSLIFGVLPAAIGLGVGAETRRPMAIATACGMLSETTLTLIVVPVIYLLIDDAAEWVKGRLRRIVGASPEAVSAK